MKYLIGYARRPNFAEYGLNQTTELARIEYWRTSANLKQSQTLCNGSGDHHESIDLASLLPISPWPKRAFHDLCEAQ
jgi:hypothetical protein